MPRLDDIEIFVNVFEQKSLTLAARKTGLPVTTVSRKLGELEKRLGATLINRTTRSLAPTDAGNAFYEKVSQAYEAIRDAEIEVSGRSREPAGSIRLLTPYGLGLQLVRPWITDFAERYPAVAFQVMFDNSPRDPVDAGADIAFRIGAVGDSSLMIRRLGLLRLVLVASPDYLDRFGAPAHPDDLAEHRLLTVSVRPGTRPWTLVDGEERAEVRKAPALVANDPTMILDSTLAGAGIARISSVMVRDHLADGRLMRVLPGWSVSGELQVSALYPRRIAMDPKIRLFLDHVAKSTNGSLSVDHG